MRTILRILLAVGLLVFLLLLFRPDFVTNAGNALLNSVGSSTAYGSAQVVPNTSGKGTDMQVSLQGLNSSRHYVVALEQGSCGGRVLKTIGNVSASSDGNASTTVSLADVNAPAQQGVWVDVHQDSLYGPSVACGQVQINSALANQSNTTSDTSSTTGGATTNSNTAGVTNSGVPGVTGSTSTGGLRDSQDPSNTGPNGFPQTGVAPAKGNAYDNYKFPRKY